MTCMKDKTERKHSLITIGCDLNWKADMIILPKVCLIFFWRDIAESHRINVQKKVE